MKKLFIFFTAFFAPFFLVSCNNFNSAEIIVEIPIGSTSASYSSQIVGVSEFNSFFIKFEISKEVEENEVEVTARFREKAGSGQLATAMVELECLGFVCDGFAVSPPSDAFQFSISILGEPGLRADNFEIETQKITTKRSWSLVPTVSAQLEQLGIISREEWGADESWLLKVNDFKAGSSHSTTVQKCQELQSKYPVEFRTDGREISTNSKNEDLQWPKKYSEEIRKIVIHHSAEDSEKDLNGDNKYTIEDVEAMMQIIYHYHAKTKGWGDIGYNFLIDAFGNIYEGRSGGDFVVGGHAYCANIGSIGIAFIGNFQKGLPTLSALASAEKLLGELANFYNLDLTEYSNWHDKNLRNLIGHRDVGVTACPGETLYSHLGELATGAMEYADSNKMSDIDYDFRILEKNSPLFLPIFEDGVVEFKIKNVGRKAWEEGSKIRLSNTEIRRNQKGVIVAGGQQFIIELNQRVSPGLTATLKIPIKANIEAGHYRFGLIPDFGGGDLRKFYLIVNVTEPTDLDYEIVETIHPPSPFAPSLTAEAEIVLRNKTNFIWQASGQNRMILETSDSSISEFTGSQTIGLLEKNTPPGELGKFKIKLTAPEKAARYYLEFRPAVESGLKLPDYEMKFHITVREPRFSGELLDRSAGDELRIDPGETKNLFLEFKNTSQVDWNSDQFELAIIQNSGVRIDSKNLVLPNEVARNANIRIEFPLIAPVKAGKYLLILQPRWQNGKVKEMKPIDFLLEVNSPRLTGELIEKPELLILNNGESEKVVFKYKNTGNVVWNNRDIVFQTLPAEVSPFSTQNWISPTRPTGLKEISVQPGEIGTFEFTVQKSTEASKEIQVFTPTVRGLGRIRGRAAEVEIHNANLAVESFSQKEISNPGEPLIRIKLSFESDRIEVGGGGFAIEQFGEVVFRGNFADFKVTDFAENEYLRVFPEDETILEIPNFNNPNWNGTLNYNKFRGVLEIRRVGGSMVVINELPLESYLAGVAEPAPSDPIEKKKLMALLARSYALYYIDPVHRKFPGKSWDGSDSPVEFQRYLGYNYEILGEFHQFVEATEGEVVTFDGSVVKTPYFTSSGGMTKTATEANWNVADFKFIKSVEDPWSCGLTSTALGSNYSCPENARGHGVGVSGKGATGLAREGKNMVEILNYFFKEVEVEKVY